MAIELKLTGRCKGCPGAEPVFHKLNADGHTVEIIAGCANSRICRHIERHLMKYIDEHPLHGSGPAGAGYLSMGELIPFPIRIRPTDYWQFYDSWAVDARWQSCTDCRRPLCVRAGKGFVACAYHTSNPAPPEPYDYTPKEET